MKKIIITMFGAILFCIVIQGIGIAEYESIVIDDCATWSDPVLVPKGECLNVSIIPNSNSSLTITLKRWLPGDTSSGGDPVRGDRDVDTWSFTGSEPAQEYITTKEAEYAWYWIGCDETADYTDGNATCRIGRDN
jgi:hypothetical protein